MCVDSGEAAQIAAFADGHTDAPLGSVGAFRIGKAKIGHPEFISARAKLRIGDVVVVPSTIWRGHEDGTVELPPPSQSIVGHGDCNGALLFFLRAAINGGVNHHPFGAGDGNVVQHLAGDHAVGIVGARIITPGERAKIRPCVQVF